MNVRISRRAALVGAAGLLLVGASGVTHADQFPSGPIRVVVATAAGGSVDTVARIIAAEVSNILGQRVVVENRSGASGTLAYGAVAQAAPDGYTLLVGSEGIVISERLVPNPGYDSQTSFAPITIAVRAPQLLVTHPKSGLRTVQDYVKAVKERPGKVTLGTPGSSGIPTLVSEMLNHRLGGLKVRNVPYRGGGPAMVDLLAGRVDAVMLAMTATTEYVRQGRLVPLAISTATRSRAQPDTPTFAETVAPGFDVSHWTGFLAPAGTPPAVVDRLHKAFGEALSKKNVADRLTDLGFTIVAIGPQKFKELLKEDSERFAEAIRVAGLKPAAN